MTCIASVILQQLLRTGAAKIGDEGQIWNGGKLDFKNGDFLS
jgi:hypothetical protein